MKKKVLFISLHRPDRNPSQRFRFEQYLDYLEDNGFECTHTFLLNAKRDKIFYSKKIIQKAFILIHSLIVLIKEVFFNKYDLVFVQREAFMLGTSFFERKFAKKSKMIFDFDDAIWQNQIGFNKSRNRILYFLKNPAKTEQIIKASHMVFAGNEFLADYAAPYSDNIKIIPTTIDTDDYRLVEKQNRDKVCVGWTGSFSTIIYIEELMGIFKKLKEKYGDKVYFKIIGDATFKNEELGIEGLPWKMDTELEDLSEIDIGLMPLPDDEWTKGKCALKGLQYMALGMPTIMSPVGVNSEVIQHGENGFLAGTDQEWIDTISQLIESYELRQRLGLAGRKTVVDKYSVEANKDLYVKYFNEVLNE